MDKVGRKTYKNLLVDSKDNRHNRQTFKKYLSVIRRTAFDNQLGNLTFFFGEAEVRFIPLIRKGIG